MSMLIDSLKKAVYKDHILKCLRFGDTQGSGDALYRIIQEAKCFYIPDYKSLTPVIESLQGNFKVVPDLCKLPHSPMVIETTDDEARIAIYLWKTQWERGEGYEGLYFEKIKSTNEIKCPILFGFDPASLKMENDIPYLETSMLMLEPTQLSPMNDDGFQAVILTVMCYVALLNSPKIIVMENVDLEKLNKKRVKNNKEPLTNYSIIHLQKTIKRQLGEQSNNHGVSFHWRRGHFKAKPKGLTWWNPHTVGSKEYGETKSAYLVDSVGEVLQ